MTVVQTITHYDAGGTIASDSARGTIVRYGAGGTVARDSTGGTIGSDGAGGWVVHDKAPNAFFFAVAIYI
jgi:hypothetical protein